MVNNKNTEFGAHKYVVNLYVSVHLDKRLFMNHPCASTCIHYSYLGYYWNKNDSGLYTFKDGKIMAMLIFTGVLQTKYCDGIGLNVLVLIDSLLF